MMIVALVVVVVVVGSVKAALGVKLTSSSSTSKRSSSRTCNTNTRIGSTTNRSSQSCSAVLLAELVAIVLGVVGSGPGR
eukprot:3676768-Pyramimonas_sp.AAC.1